MHITRVLKIWDMGSDAHDYPNHYVEQQYLPDEIKNARFYEPSDLGYEKQIKEHLQKLRKQ